MTGADLVALARTRVGQKYVLGAKVDYTDPNWSGPWDCAELPTWAAYQATGKLHGVTGGNAFSGAWAAIKEGVISVEAGIRIPGAILVRAPSEDIGGHVAISAGGGRTVEAYSTARGVIDGTATGRRWTSAVLVPGVDYRPGDDSPPPRTPPLLRLTSPRMTHRGVSIVQRIVGVTADGVYGPETARAVAAWQAEHGLVADGEVGPLTWAALLSRTS